MILRKIEEHPITINVKLNVAQGSQEGNECIHTAGI